MRIPYLVGVTLLSMVTVSFAAFSDYRDRDASRFVKKEVKPFHSDADVISVVMREGIPRGGGYTYQYPRENPEPVMTDVAGAKEGDLAMEIELIADDYSGVAICIAGSVDLTPYLEEGVLEFWIKGAKGEENALFVLVDDGVKSNGSDGSGDVDKDDDAGQTAATPAAAPNYLVFGLIAAAVAAGFFFIILLKRRKEEEEQ